MPEPQARVLEAAECRALLARVGWGVLATVADGRPYALPVGYAVGDGVLYLATGAGRKLDNLERDPRVCLTVCEVASFDSWRSVLVEGEAIPVTGATAVARAVAAFVMQSAPRGAADVSYARRLSEAKFLRVALDAVTGRSRG